MFKSRVALAATLSGNYGIYNGFELLEHEPIPGKEEYLNSEKYEIKVRDWNKPGNIKTYIARLNRLRREQPGAAADQQPALPAQVDDGDVIGFVKESVDQRQRRRGRDRAVARRPREFWLPLRRYRRSARRRTRAASRAVENLVTGERHTDRMGRRPPAHRSGARSRAAVPLPGVRRTP